VPLTIKIRNFYRTFSITIVRTLFLFTCTFLFSTCDSAPKGPSTGQAGSLYTAQDYSFPYRLDRPDDEYKLPSYLEEISGVSFYKDDKLVCVQDEKANIYLLPLEKDPDIKKYDFGKDGDYEDIATDGKTVYVLRNDGTIFRIKDLKGDELKVRKYKTPLSGKNDTEGLAFDPLTNSLLIACKGSPSIGDENPYKGYRAVYRFDLESGELVRKPRYLVDLNNLNTYRDRSTFDNFSLKLAKRLRLIDSEASFQPSGIAMHPVYEDIYMISSIGKLMIVMDRRGKILDIRDLDIKLFRQPEGICFSPAGDLYISSEGQGGKGYILKFKPQSNE
jgi:uncharacterized protein YjiK